jgi:hypothetical protein
MFDSVEQRLGVGKIKLFAAVLFIRGGGNSGRSSQLPQTQKKLDFEEIARPWLTNFVTSALHSLLYARGRPVVAAGFLLYF